MTPSLPVGSLWVSTLDEDPYVFVLLPGDLPDERRRLWLYDNEIECGYVGVSVKAADINVAPTKRIP